MGKTSAGGAFQKRSTGDMESRGEGFGRRGVGLRVLGAEEFENAITTPVGVAVTACERARARVVWIRARRRVGRSAGRAAQPGDVRLTCREGTRR
jgi:hypothetical protein